MKDLDNQLIMLIKLVEETTMLFYQQKDQEAYIKLVQVINELTTMMVVLEEISSSGSFNIDNNKLLTILKDAMNALEDKDTILIADILQYELIEQLKDIRNILQCC